VNKFIKILVDVNNEWNEENPFYKEDAKLGFFPLPGIHILIEENATDKINQKLWLIKPNNAIILEKDFISGKKHCDVFEISESVMKELEEIYVWNKDNANHQFRPNSRLFLGTFKTTYYYKELYFDFNENVFIINTMVDSGEQFSAKFGKGK
jgi:hypothetical protein